MIFCVVLSQVNSDVVFYRRQKDGTLEPVRVNQTHVGRMVLTKAVLHDGRRDITSDYKFPEGDGCVFVVLLFKEDIELTAKIFSIVWL